MKLERLATALLLTATCVACDTSSSTSGDASMSGSDAGPRPPDDRDDGPAMLRPAEVLATRGSFVMSIAVDDDHVYWGRRAGDEPMTGEVGRVPKTGGAVQVLATGLGDYVAEMHVEGDYVYFLSLGKLLRVRKDGSSSTPEQVAPRSPSTVVPVSLSFGEGDLFYLERSTESIVRTRLDGSGARTIWTGQYPEFDIGEIYYHDRQVYFGSWYDVLRVPADGTAEAVKIATDPGRYPYHFAADDSGLYWTRGGDSHVTEGGVFFLPTGSSTPVELVSGIGAPMEIVTTQRYAFFSSVGELTPPTILRLDKGAPAGAMPGVLAEQGEVQSLAIDDDFVYFGEVYTGKIGRIPRR